MKTKIIALSGKKQSGKSSCTNFIYANYMSAVFNDIDGVGIDDKGVLHLQYDKREFSFDVFDYYHDLPDQDPFIKDVINIMSPNVKIYSFADILKKNVCIDILDLKHNQCYGTDNEKNELVDCYQNNKQLTAREVMQIVGTDFFRSISKDIWPKATIKQIQQDAPQVAIINDCRFPNEVDYVQKNNGVVIRLTRDICGPSDHKSENALDKENYDWNKFDYILDNADLNITEQSQEIINILQKEIK